MTIPSTHFATVARAFADGRIIPILGAGVNLCDRPPGTDYKRGGTFLPSGNELARELVRSFGYPPQEKADLVRVSQYVAVVEGTGPLYEKLRSLFDTEYPATTLHRFLAGIPPLLRGKGYPPRPQLVITTNYDDALERAYREAGEPFDLVAYIADGDDRGKFRHWTPDGQARLVERPNEYRGEWRASDADPLTTIDQRSVIVKLHGACVREHPDLDSYVITEDHYIEYLTRSDVTNLLPVTLAARMKRSHFLFLGYSLSDWNLRVILHRIWGNQALTFRSWAVQLEPDQLEQEFWRARGVDILKASLAEYVQALQERTDDLPRFGDA